MKNHLRAYIRPEPRFSTAKQTAPIAALKQKIAMTYTEDFRHRADGMPERENWISSLRPDTLAVVSDFHRLSPNASGLKEVRALIRAKGAVILEARTGRRSDNAEDLADMVQEALDWHRRGGLTTDIARAMGKKGAINSPRTKIKDGRMLQEDAKKYWFDPSLTVEQALEKINSDDTYTTKWNLIYGYRALGPRDVGAGPMTGRRAKYVAEKKKQEAATKGLIYFIRARSGPVKIGFSVDIRNRIAALQTSHHAELRVIAAMPGTYKDEAALHKRFKAYRLKGEWFKFEGDVKDFIVTLPKHLKD